MNRDDFERCLDAMERQKQPRPRDVRKAQIVACCIGWALVIVLAASGGCWAAFWTVI